MVTELGLFLGGGVRRERKDYLMETERFTEVASQALARAEGLRAVMRRRREEE